MLFSQNIAIIGAGPAGLYASYCSGISGLNCALIESSQCVGGQCIALYPDKPIYGIPGTEKSLSQTFISKLAEQCLPLASDLVLGQKVESIAKHENRFIISTDKNNQITSNFLIIASGIGEMKPSVPSTILGLENAQENFIQYYCMKIDLYKGKKVIIAGGGDSAADFALNIAAIAKEVFLIHRRDKMTCEESKFKSILETKNITLILSENILCVKNNVVTTNKSVYPSDYLVFCYGFIASNSMAQSFQNLGIKMKNNLIDINISTMETACEHCYAIGDVVTYENKKKNILPAFFEADRAIRAIKSKMDELKKTGENDE